MKYYKSKLVEVEGEVSAFVAPDHITNENNGHLMYDRLGNIEYHGLSDDVDPEEVLALQHEVCEVEEVSFADIEEILKGSRLYTEINNQIESRIREKYSIGHEFSLLKLDPNSEEYLEYQSFVDQCREEGRLQKIALGLKQ